jgi:hypothetical protein
MKPEETTRQAGLVVASLQGLSLCEALAVLVQTMANVLEHHAPGREELDQPCPAVNPYLRRKPSGQVGIIDSNPEMKAFLHSLGDEYRTIGQIRQMLVTTFGVKRAPSESSIHRYLQKIAKQQAGVQEGNE